MLSVRAAQEIWMPIAGSRSKVLRALSQANSFCWYMTGSKTTFELKDIQLFLSLNASFHHFLVNSLGLKTRLWKFAMLFPSRLNKRNKKWKPLLILPFNVFWYLCIFFYLTSIFTSSLYVIGNFFYWHVFIEVRLLVKSPRWTCILCHTPEHGISTVASLPRYVPLPRS